MRHPTLVVIVSLLLMLVSLVPASFALGTKEAMASFVLPTSGQTMNGEFGSGKSKLMAGVEAVSVATTAVLAATGGAVWWGIAPLIANHTWSAVDAYKGAKRKVTYEQVDQMTDAQRSIELSREQRYQREQTSRSDFQRRMAELEAEQS